MIPVNITKCDKYNKEEIKNNIKNGLNSIGFNIESLKGKYIGLKPNLLMPSKIENAIVTHPIFFEAVVEVVKEQSDNIIIIESPAMTSLENTLKKSGYNDIVQKHNLKIADLSKVTTLHNSEAARFKTIEVAEETLNLDVLINIPKLKTHNLTMLTGAVKNLFGLMPGMKKSKMHFKAPTGKEFSEFLLDFYGGVISLFKEKGQILHIMDGIRGMEGNGPGPGGTARELGVILLSEDAIALDYAVSQIVSFDYKDVITTREGINSPYGPNSIEEITMVGDDLKTLRIKDFKPPASRLYEGAFWGWLVKLLKPLLTDKPVPQKDRCTLCYHCKKICPAEAISIAGKNGKVPVYDYNKCIRCYCCTETCPEAAIDVKKGKLQWILK